MTAPLSEYSAPQAIGRPAAAAAGPPQETDPVEALAARLAEELGEAWKGGERRRAEEVLAVHPELLDHPRAALRLVYEEVCLRQEHGLEEEPEAVLARFPRWAGELRVLLDCHRLFKPPAEPAFPQAGATWAEFRLLAEMGRGAQGRVFLATQPDLADRPVVLKLTPRTGREHLSLARLQHTAIVPLYFAQDDPARNVRTLGMPYFGGVTLARVLERLKDTPPGRRTGGHILEALDRSQEDSPIPPPARGPARLLLARSSYAQAVCLIGISLAEALQYAHERGLVHLDVKPSNLLLAADGQPMLLDFHLAQSPISPNRPAPAWVGGTLAYMPREQQAAMAAVNAGQPVAAVVDGRADIYALGALLYEALGGRVPYLPGVSPPLERCNAQVTPGLSDVVHKCLAYHAGDRYQDAAALAADLRRHLNDQKLRGVPNRSWKERWHKWRRRKPHALFVNALLLLALAAAVAGGFSRWQYVRKEEALAREDLEGARKDLEAGTKFLDRTAYTRAAEAFRRGLETARKYPAARDLRRRFATQLRLTGRLENARNLHTRAEQLRSLYGADALSPRALRLLDAACREVWRNKESLVVRAEPGLPAAVGEGVRNDLLDVAVMWSDVCVRLAADGDGRRACRQALGVLAEAETLCGPSAVLEQGRRALAQTLGDEELAGRAARRAARLTPRTAWEYCLLGRSLLRSGKWQEAEAALDRAVALDPRGLWPHYYRGVYAYRHGLREKGEPARRCFEDAAGAFGVCIALARHPALCYYNRGQAYRHLGLTDRALRDYRRALEGDIDPATVYYNMALLHEQRRQRGAALECLEKALRHNAYYKDAQDLYQHLKR
jgi:serine/threonine protein kinase/Tfp pilus assembly protein PilF